VFKNYVNQGLSKCSGKIEDGDKNPYRQIFEMLIVYVNTGVNTIVDSEAKLCAQEALDILLKQRLVSNEDNERMMAEFGYNNSQEI
jgi:hypothetical protein